MEKRITNKIDDYIKDFKKDIKDYIDTELNVSNEQKCNILKFVYDYDSINLDKTDFAKRKRVKSVVPLYLRCTAKRASGEQCTRKKRDDSCFCGTHDKNRPHGVIDKMQDDDIKMKKKEIFLQEINGILYYLDHDNNVYNTTDIINNKINPSVFAKYDIVDGMYNLII